MPFRAEFSCLWCGAAARACGTGRPRGLGPALSRLPRSSRREPVPSLPAAGRARRTGGRERLADRPPRSVDGGRRRMPRAPASRPPIRAVAADGAADAGADADARPGDARLLRGAGAASTTTGTSAAAATPAVRSTTWPGSSTSTRPAAGSTSCRSAATSSSSRPGTGWWSPLLASQGPRCGATTARRLPWSAPASGSSPTACAPTSTSATPGRSRTRSPTPCSRASG